MTNSDSLPAFLDRLADAATTAIMPHFRTPLTAENKAMARFDPVTIADRAAEEAMRVLINTHFPTHGIIGEELGNEREDAEYVWVLDPIDGTRSFISGLPTWGTLIGLKREGRPVLGMMAQPFTGERFAGDGTRAWYTGPGGPRDLKTRRCASLADASLFTTTPALFRDGDRISYDRIEAAVRMPRYGYDCYAYCMVAAGNTDLVIEAGLQPYDVVALIPIVEGAGGRMTAWDGSPATEGGRILAAGDPTLYEMVRQQLSG